MPKYLIGFAAGALFVFLLLQHPGILIVLAVTAGTILLTVVACTYLAKREERKPLGIYIED
jgi:hypothetical protein